MSASQKTSHIRSVSLVLTYRDLYSWAGECNLLFWYGGKRSWSRSSADQLLLFHHTSSPPPALFDFPSTCRSVCFPPCIPRLMYGGWEVIGLHDHLNLCATSSTSGEMLVSAMIFFLLTHFVTELLPKTVSLKKLKYSLYKVVAWFIILQMNKKQ